MDWFVHALLVLMAQIQIVGIMLSDYMGIPGAGDVILRLGGLLMDYQSFAETPDGVERAVERIGSLLNTP